MLSTSKDVLLITIALCVAAITFFSCWGLYYLVGMLRNVFKVSKDARKILEKIEETIDAVKDKIHSSASYLFLIGEATKKILDIMGSIKSGEGSFNPFKEKRKDRNNCECDDEYYEKRETKKTKPRTIKVKGK